MSVRVIEVEAGFYADLLREVETLRAENAALWASRQSDRAVELLARALFDEAEPVDVEEWEAAGWDDAIVTDEDRAPFLGRARALLARLDAVEAPTVDSPESATERATRWSGTEPPEHVAPTALLRTLDDRDEEPGEPDGEAFRGGEAEAFDRWQMDGWRSLR